MGIRRKQLQRILFHETEGDSPAIRRPLRIPYAGALRQPDDSLFETISNLHQFDASRLQSSALIVVARIDAHAGDADFGLS